MTMETDKLNLVAKLIAIIGHHLGAEQARITPSTDLVEEFQLDSLDVLDIVTAISKELHVEDLEIADPPLTAERIAAWLSRNHALDNLSISATSGS